MNSARRRFLHAISSVAWRGPLWWVLGAGVAPLLGRALTRRRWSRRRRPDDLAPIPWIGHC